MSGRYLLNIKLARTHLILLFLPLSTLHLHLLPPLQPLPDWLLDLLPTLRALPLQHLRRCQCPPMRILYSPWLSSLQQLTPMSLNSQRLPTTILSYLNQTQALRVHHPCSL